MCFPYLFINASTDAYEEEAYEEEEEHFDNSTNQGKLIPMQAIVRHCKSHLQFIDLGKLYQSQVFTLQAFTSFDQSPL